MNNELITIEEFIKEIEGKYYIETVLSFLMMCKAKYPKKWSRERWAEVLEEYVSQYKGRM